MEYKFGFEDFKKVVEFSVKYFLDPHKSKSGRTTGEPRGLGGTMDAFIRGKLGEIGVSKMMGLIEGEKECHIDLEIKDTKKASEEPDIISITENDKQRPPKLFVEIKNLSSRSRWIGLNKKQLRTLKGSCEGKNIFIVYCDLETNIPDGNKKTGDYLGMYLKKITKSQCFKGFTDLNSRVNLDFIISIDELEKYGAEFPKGDLFYKTQLFVDKTSFVKTLKGSIRKGISVKKSYKNYSAKLCVPRKDGSVDTRVGKFDVKGSFDILIKKNTKTLTSYIDCKKDTIIENNVFGRYELKGGSVYCFLLETVGEDPELKQDNIFISKKVIYQLIKDGNISDPEKRLKEITQLI